MTNSRKDTKGMNNQRMRFPWTLPFVAVILVIDAMAVGDSKQEAHQYADKQPLSMTFVGDIMFGRYRENGLNRNPKTDVPIFDEVAGLIAADVAVANLETPLLYQPPPRTVFPSDLLFAAGPWAGAQLRQAGFNVVSMANNHVYDMRQEGILDTLDILDKNRIVPVGAPMFKDSPFRVVTIEKKGWRIGFIGVTGLRNSIDRPGMMRLPYIPAERDVPIVLGPIVQEAKGTHDIIVVLIHWGASDMDYPSQPRVDASRKLIDMGAQLIIGHHPHVLQGIEKYKNGIIAHSLGDFIFDKILDKHRLTGVLRAWFEPGRPTPRKVVFHPVVVVRSEGNFKPVPTRGVFYRSVSERLRRLSQRYRTTWEPKGDRLVLSMSTVQNNDRGAHETRVIPAQAGIHVKGSLDSRLRGNDRFLQ